MVLFSCRNLNPRALVVGMELNYPPIRKMIDDHGQPAGVSVAMAQALGRFLGLNIQIQNTPFDGLIPGA